MKIMDFPCGSAGKESACNAGDLGSIPRLGRSPEEGKGYQLQHFGLESSMDCTYLPKQREAVGSLSQEDPLDEGMASHSSILAWRIPWTEEPGRLQSTESWSQTQLKRLSTHTTIAVN